MVPRADPRWLTFLESRGYKSPLQDFSAQAAKIRGPSLDHVQACMKLWRPGMKTKDMGPTTKAPVFHGLLVERVCDSTAGLPHLQNSGFIDSSCDRQAWHSLKETEWNMRELQEWSDMQWPPKRELWASLDKKRGEKTWRGVPLVIWYRSAQKDRKKFILLIIRVLKIY